METRDNNSQRKVKKSSSEAMKLAQIKRTEKIIKKEDQPKHDRHTLRDEK